MPGTWARLWNALRPRPPLQSVRIVVFTRDNCPLCDEAAHFLEARRRRLGFSLQFIDVDQDPALRERYCQSVPVVEVNGKVRFRGQINPVQWERLMTALRRQS